MTAQAQKAKNPTKVNKLLLIVAFVFLTGLFIKNSGLAAEYVRAALALCAETVIPSVFPCAVLSGIFVALGGGELVASFCSAPMKKLFGLSGTGAAVLFLGLFCGFPVGAVAGAHLLRRGELSESELFRLMLFSNLPSPAFCISAVGESMLGSKNAGITLYLITLVVSLFFGTVLRFFYSSSTESPKARSNDTGGIGIKIAASITSAASSMLNLCASVVFFSVLTKVLLFVLGNFFEFEPFSAAVGCVFELSGGCSAAASLGGKAAFCLCAFALGWNGLCVHFQIISACGKLPKLPLYFLTKFLQGLVCAAVALVLPVTV